MWSSEDDYFGEADHPLDPVQRNAEQVLRQFFREHRESVFFSRQLEVQHEHLFFHWITNRALRTLIETGEVMAETRELSTGGDIKLMWNRGYRYYRRAAVEVVRLVEEYAHPNIGGALGLHGDDGPRGICPESVPTTWA
jgi:hypothetical protein